MLNPPTALQEDTIHNIIRRMSILCPRNLEILPRWLLKVILKGLMKPRFIINGSDRNLSLELPSYKTAFLVALPTGARGSELVALSRAAHNLDFTTLESGAKQVSIRMVPNFIPKNQCPDHSKTIGIPGHRSFVSKRSRKTPVSCEGTRPLLDLICGKGERRSTRETFSAFLPGYSTLHHPLLVLGGRDHPPYLWKLVWIWPSQDSCPWCKSGGCLHSLLQEHSLVWAMWSDRMEVP